MLEKPSELLLYGPVEEGGLGLHHVQRLLKILISLKHILFFLCISFSFSASVVCCFLSISLFYSFHSLQHITYILCYVLLCYVSIPLVSCNFSLYFNHLVLYISLYTPHSYHLIICMCSRAYEHVHLFQCIYCYASHSIYFIPCISFFAFYSVLNF